MPKESTTMPTRRRLAATATLALATLALVPLLAGNEQDAAPYKNASLPVEQRVKDLLGRMTLDEKVGQMIQADSDSLKLPDVGKYYLGSVLSGGGSEVPDISAKGWFGYVESVQKQALATRLAVPILYGIDAVHGHNNVRGATVFPHNIGLGATRNPKLVEEVSRITAIEVAATGMHWAFGPCVTVPQDERWGRTYEGFGESPELVALLGPAAVRGLQGADPGKPRPVIASVKHYVGDGGTQGGVDRGDVKVDEATLRAVHMAGYGPSIQAGAATIMASYNSVHGQKMHGNRHLLTDVLVGELGFKGFVISDWKAIEELPGSFSDQIVASVNAGVDMLMQPDNYADAYTKLRQLAQDGKIPMARIDEAVRRILTVKFQMGLFEKPFGEPSWLPKVGSPEHRAVARQAVRESQVLLANKNGTLPLKEGLSSILVAGKAGDDIGLQSGGWTISWQGDSGPVTDGTTVLEAVRKAAPGASVAYSWNGRDIPKGAQAAIVVIGEQPYAEMKGDRVQLDLDAQDVAVVKRVKQAGLPTIVVLFSGRPLMLDTILPFADAIVAAWLPGTEGDGIADVLFGKYNPTGKLSVTWPKSMAQIPINVGPKGERPKEQPLFEYGFGLSYGAK
jgi:beta-glucosidase